MHSQKNHTYIVVHFLRKIKEEIMNYKVVSRHEVGNVIEFTMDIGDWSYLVVFGCEVNV